MTTVLGSRYELVDVLGEGGFGVVWRAQDTATDAVVAVKWMKPRAEADMLRLRRELIALQVLQVPGVVRLLDHGEAEGRPYFVTELVHGLPFPGRTGAIPWSELRGPLLAVVDTTARIHEAGMIHRDLKPANILVDGRGVPTLLDFGLARGSEGGDTVTATGSVVGTPRYMSPELLLGAKPRSSADLYAIGAMAYEALTGIAPHGDHQRGLVPSRVREPVTPPVVLAPSVPSGPAEVILRMLSPDPTRRYSDAHAVAAALRDADRSLSTARLPWLGSDASVARLEQAIRLGGLVRLAGPRGSGRTAVVDRACRRVDQPAYRLRPGRGAFQGLAEVLEAEPLSALADATMAEITAHVQAVLERLAGERAVLVADGWSAVDRRTRAVLGTPPPGLTVVQVVDGRDGDVVLEAMPRETLRTLFHGPDRLLHLQEDGAEALWERTGGLPSRIAAEVDAWVRAGLATWEGDRLRVGRAAIDRLRSGLRVGPARFGSASTTEPLPDTLDDLLGIVDLCGDHATKDVLRRATAQPEWLLEDGLDDLAERGAADSIDGVWRARTRSRRAQAWTQDRRRDLHRCVASAMPVDAPQRWRHLLLAGEARLATEAVLAESRRLATRGALGEAASVLEPVLEAVREAGHLDEERRLLQEWSLVAFSSALPAAMEQARFQVRRSAASVETLEVMLDAALLAARGDGTGALERLDAAAPRAPELRTWQQALRVAAAQTLPPSEMGAVLDDVEKWAHDQGDAESLARVAGWRGLMAYRQGRFAEAIELHRQVDSLGRERLSARLSARLNTAGALLDTGDLDAALAIADEVASLARDARLTTHEARATWVVRAATYRRGEAHSVDNELVEAAQAMSNDAVAAMLLHNEASVAWRLGQRAAACELANAAASRHASGGRHVAAAFARCLALAAGDEPRAGEAEGLAQALGPAAPPGFRWQAKALWPPLAIDPRAPVGDPERVREVLAPAEAAEPTT